MAKIGATHTNISMPKFSDLLCMLGLLYITESHIFGFFKNGLVLLKIA